MTAQSCAPWCDGPHTLTPAEAIALGEMLIAAGATAERGALRHLVAVA